MHLETRFDTAGWMRRLGKALATPFDPEDYLALFDARHSAREIRARVHRVRREGDRAVTLELAPNRLWRPHKAGQHVMLGVDIGGVRHQRCFSLSSAPSDPRPAITVKRHGPGGVSDHLVNHCREGDLVTLSPATGDFVLPEAAPERILFLTAGSGVTPVHSIVKSLLASNYEGQLVWAHFERGYHQWLLGESLRGLALDDRLDFRLVLTGDTPRDGDQAGRLNEHWLTEQVPDAAGRTLFTCGPEGFLDTVIDWHRRHGRAPIFHERFQSAPASGGDGGRVRFARSGGDVQAEGAQSLLEAAEAAGLRPKHGCRMGICHTCKCRVTRGRVRDLQSGARRELADQEIRICVHGADGDVELDL
ncbi:NADPH oxidoreductase [Alcanivorax sp. ALC70]|nr:iron-sulfur cluster-binding domain-containing protein [Alcanivorax sp. ZXX171]QJX03118.1 iron-sulfur cluster-binding domain-containing protein [Alcanivorax sp. IO_7]UWN51478.1 NADPH oxidoreductase [Alcanivorax sp. ALC70]